MSRRVAGSRQAHTANMTCSSAADSGRSRSGSPYICAAPPFAFFFYVCLCCSIIPGFVGKGKRQKSR